MPTPDTSPLAKLIDLRLRNQGDSQDLASYVASARDAGNSWRSIASDIKSQTGESVHHSMLLDWFPEYRDKASA